MILCAAPREAIESDTIIAARGRIVSRRTVKHPGGACPAPPGPRTRWRVIPDQPPPKAIAAAGLTGGLPRAVTGGDGHCRTLGATLICDRGCFNAGANVFDGDG
jgi:hypothetical protein